MNRIVIFVAILLVGAALCGSWIYKFETRPVTPALRQGLAALARCENSNKKCIGGYVISASTMKDLPDPICRITGNIDYNGTESTDDRCQEPVGQLDDYRLAAGVPAEEIKAVVLKGDPDFAAVKKRYEAQEN